MSRVRAWIKPLQYDPKSQRTPWQYYARVDKHTRAMGSEWSYEAAEDAIHDYVYGLIPGYEDWSIVLRDPTHV